MGDAEARPQSPPLLAGRIQGVRAWTLFGTDAEADALLGSRATWCYWPRGRPLTARCTAAADDAAHRVPASGCSCGIYAWHPARAASASDVRSAPWQEGEAPQVVAGVIEAWGRIEVHWDGFRAEKARPVALFADPGAPPGHRRVIEGLADSYGLAIVEVESAAELVAHCRALPGALVPSWLEDLLASQVTVALAPEAVGFLSGRDRVAVGGSGHLPEGTAPPDRWRPELEVELPGVRIARIAGVSFRPHALQDRAFDPGRPVHLLPEPHNRHDPNAIGVWDERLRRKAGYIPAELAPAVGRMLREGHLRVAVSLWQWRDLESGERIGLHILLSGTERVTLGPYKRWRGADIGEAPAFDDEEIEW